MAAVISTTLDYAALLPAFILGGTGMAMFFAPIANLVLGSVRREQEGIASGVNNALREFGGVLGIAVMGAVFSANGGYGPTATESAPQHFIDGLIPAVFTGAAILAVATLAMWLVPSRRPAAPPRRRGTILTRSRKPKRSRVGAGRTAARWKDIGTRRAAAATA